MPRFMKISLITTLIFLLLSCEDEPRIPWEGDNYSFKGKWDCYDSEMNLFDFTVKMLLDSTLIIDTFISPEYYNEEGIYKTAIEYDHSEMVKEYPDFPGVLIEDSRFSFNDTYHNFPEVDYMFKGVFTDSLKVQGEFRLNRSHLNIKIYEEYHGFKNQNKLSK
jgi:hypothetical protein